MSSARTVCSAAHAGPEPALAPPLEQLRLADGRRAALHPRPTIAGEEPLRGFVVTIDGRADGAVIAEACYRRDAPTRGAEFALAVDPAWRRVGLGSLLVEALCRAARHEGLRHMVGDVPAEALPAQRLLERCGFELEAPAEAGAPCRACRALPPRQSTLQADDQDQGTVSGWVRPSRDAGRGGRLPR